MFTAFEPHVHSKTMRLLREAQKLGGGNRRGLMVSAPSRYISECSEGNYAVKPKLKCYTPTFCRRVQKAGVSQTCEKWVRRAPRPSHKYVSMSDAAESSTCMLPKKVAAIQVSCTGDGATGSGGTLSELPEGAQVIVSGDGFNSRTVKVEWQSRFYFVFHQDIEAPDFA
jgi:hypothetical protein